MDGRNRETYNRYYIGDISKYEVTITHKHAKRIRCQTLDNNQECLVTHHSNDECKFSCNTDTKRNFTEECKQLLQENMLQVYKIHVSY